MAFNPATYWHTMIGGSDATNGGGGGFDATTTSMATDLTGVSGCNGATPVVSSASYSFVASDVGAWLFVGGGTSWTKGWYQIASVASNQATLTAGIGSATAYPLSLSTVIGCATVATPTVGTWSVDYSKQTASRYSFTDMIIGATTTQFTSTLTPVTVNMIGNAIAVSAGTGFTVQRVVITAAAAGTATCDKTLGTAASTAGIGALGGSLLTRGFAASLVAVSNYILSKYNATADIVTSVSTNVTAGRVSVTNGGISTAESVWRGYEITPGDATANRPIYRWGIAGASNALLGLSGSNTRVENQVLDGNRATFALTKGIFLSAGNNQVIRNVKFMGMSGMVTGSTGFGTVFENCEFTDCATTVVGSLTTTGTTVFRNCTFHDNSVTCLTISSGRVFLNDCVFWNNTGASTSAIQMTGIGILFAENVTIATVGQHGFDIQVSPGKVQLTNCYVQGAAGSGYNIGAATDAVTLLNCGGFNNTTANYTVANLNPANVTGFLTPSSDVFTSLAGGNLTLNNTAGSGALLRAASSPASFTGMSSTTNFRDIGASQHLDSGGATTTYIYNLME